MIELLLFGLEGARKQTLRLASGIDDDLGCAQSESGEHHPVWTIGHLLLADSYMLTLIGASELPADFGELLRRHGPDSNPTSDAEEYYSLSDLVERLAVIDLHRRRAIGLMAESELQQPSPDQLLAISQPTIGHHLQAQIFHEGYHAGQLAAWRRRHGMEPVEWSLGPGRGESDRNRGESDNG